MAQHADVPGVIRDSRTEVCKACQKRATAVGGLDTGTSQPT